MLPYLTDGSLGVITQCPSPPIAVAYTPKGVEATSTAYYKYNIVLSVQYSNNDNVIISCNVPQVYG